MKQSSILFLKVVIMLIGVVALAAMIRFPQTEGRAANLDLISIYKDPFIIYMYIASISFFVALFQAFKLLGYMDNNKIFSPAAIKAIKNIKYCATAIVAFIVVALAYIFMVQRGKEDIAGGVAGGLFIIFVSFIVVAAANTFERLLQNGTDLKLKK